MSKALSIALASVSASSVLFAVLFAGGGAGIYGSPFAGVPPGWPSASAIRREQGLELLTILAGPIACLAAALLVVRASKAASFVLIVGASFGAYLGTLTRFNVVWEKVFLICVWLPMVIISIMILIGVPRGMTFKRSLTSTTLILIGAGCVCHSLTVADRVPLESRWAFWTIDAVVGLACLLGAGWLLRPRRIRA